MPVTYSRPFGMPPGVRLTSTGRYQAYANYRDVNGCKSFRSLGTFDTVGEAVMARLAFTDGLTLLAMMLDTVVRPDV